MLSANKVLAADKMLAADKIGGIKSGNEIIEKLVKSKTGKLSKSQKLSKLRKSKSEKLAKSKKPSKYGNSPKFVAKKAGLSFLTSDTKTTFNYLWLAFTKALILHYFDSKCHIWIEIDISSHAIYDILSQLNFQTNSNKIIIKTNMG